MNYRWVGSLAAVAQAVAYLAFIVLVVGLLPAVGGYVFSDFMDPAQILRKAATHPGTEPLLLALDLLDIAFAILPLLIMIAVVQRIEQATASERYIIVGFVVVNTALWLAAAAIDTAGLPAFLNLYTQHPSEAVDGYRVLGIVNLQLTNAAAGAYGISLLVMSWAAWRTRAYSRPFVVLSFAWGFIAVLSWPFIIVGALGPLVGIVWCLWLVQILVRTQTTGIALVGP